MSPLDPLPRLLTARLALRDLARERGEEASFVITRLADGALVGAIGLAFEPPLAAARLGCWIGPAWRGRGYAAEAAGAVVAYGFETLELERIWAPRLSADAAAARVLQRIGLAHEGSRFVPERGVTERLEQHGCLRWEYFARTALCGWAGAAPCDEGGRIAQAAQVCGASDARAAP
jgi:RimJ/RimL family protein N-acetyltransferase